MSVCVDTGFRNGTRRFSKIVNPLTVWTYLLPSELILCRGQPRLSGDRRSMRTRGRTDVGERYGGGHGIVSLRTPWRSIEETTGWYGLTISRSSNRGGYTWSGEHRRGWCHRRDGGTTTWSYENGYRGRCGTTSCLPAPPGNGGEGKVPHTHTHKHTWVYVGW